MSTHDRPTRRGLLGWAGAGGVGLVAGGGTGWAVASATRPVAEQSPTSGLSTTISPYGAHQPGVTAPTARVTRLLALDLLDDTDRDGLGRLMRLWTGTIEAATQGRPAPGDTARDLAQDNVDLTVTVGWGPRTVDRAGLERPACLADVPAFEHDRLDERWSGGDLVLMVAAADDTTVLHVVRRLLLDAAPFATLRWEQTGSWRGLDRHHAPTTGRNLFGQVDGSANPVPGDDAFDATVWVRDPAWLTGGTTLVVRRIRMDLTTWDDLTRDEQERSIGRDLTVGAPLGGEREHDQPDFGAQDADGRLLIPETAHIRLSHPSMNGGARLLRRGVNYTEIDPRTGTRESGLLFCSFQADVDAQFNRIQRRLDDSDQLNTWTTAVGSAVFAILPGWEPGDWLGSAALT